jgi:hypothetical protein
MAATITTKYDIGETVWFATTETVRKRHACPDCLGETKWSVTSPGGKDYTFPCPRCTATYHSDRDMSLDYSQFSPVARRLTIGSIRTDSHPAFDDEQRVEYMCRETGIGSGSIYREAHLYSTEDEALKAAQADADKRNAETEWVVEQYNKTLKLSDYQLSDAKAKATELRDNTFRYRVEDLIEAMGETSLSDEQQEAVDTFKQKVGW